MKKIILDCGSHLGESIRKFRSILPDYKQYEFYMFEANTYLFNEINSNSEFNDCKKFNVAISDKNGKVKLWGCIKNKSSVGSTTEKSKANWDNIDENDFLEIESINLSDFIKNNFDKNDYIILKMDIEGSEYDVLSEMIKTGVISYINEFYCEFHSQWMSEDTAEKEQKIKNELQKINLKISYWDALT